LLKKDQLKSLVCPKLKRTGWKAPATQWEVIGKISPVQKNAG
jgi:hypothetical protein